MNRALGNAFWETGARRGPPHSAACRPSPRLPFLPFASAGLGGADARPAPPRAGHAHGIAIEPRRLPVFRGVPAIPAIPRRSLLFSRHPHW